MLEQSRNEKWSLRFRQAQTGEGVKGSSQGLWCIPGHVLGCPGHAQVQEFVAQ